MKVESDNRRPLLNEKKRGPDRQPSRATAKAIEQLSGRINAESLLARHNQPGDDPRRRQYA